MHPRPGRNPAFSSSLPFKCAAQPEENDGSNKYGNLRDLIGLLEENISNGSSGFLIIVTNEFLENYWLIKRLQLGNLH